MKVVRYTAIFYLVTLGAIYLQSCAGVAMNFTGGRLPPDKYQNITIQNFFNDSPEGPANLGINFTERMKEYYQRNTPLKLVPESQQLDLGGSIVGYAVSPVAPGGGDVNQQAQLQRLTITVKVDYTDYVTETSTFTKNFSFFKDFGADQTLIAVEAEFIEEIFDQIVFDIFNATYANW
ncbi:MAG: hypothetical protein ACI85I_000149 [Arenicella sp.]|jgi:hypothetical protein